mmetsp:Transcript_15955/g.37169  ORF Transcript_15955/g.37169 Transcript_15955/m.37169 type:complete len:228 (-) Transcript_15955:529-1212(-)
MSSSANKTGGLPGGMQHAPSLQGGFRVGWPSPGLAIYATGHLHLAAWRGHLPRCWRCHPSYVACACVRCEGLVCESPSGGFVICMGGYSTDRPQGACLPPALPPALLSLHVEGLVELVHETGPEVGLQLGNRAGAVRKEQGLLRAVRANLLNHIEVLGKEEEVHHVLRPCALDAIREVHDTVAQAVHDGLALPGHADAGEVFGLGVGLGGLDVDDFFGLGLLIRRGA